MKYIIEHYQITGDEYERLAKNFFGIKARDYSDAIASQNAGGLDDPYDMRIYNLMLHADTVHDFVETEADKDEYFNDFDIDIPSNIDITNTRGFINKMSSSKQLKFRDGEAIANPMYGADILDKLLIDDAPESPLFEITLGNLEKLDDLFKTQQRSLRGKIGSKQKLVPVDIWTGTHFINVSEAARKFELIKLMHIAQLCCVFRDKLGARREVQIDNSDNNLIMLLFATKYMSQAFTKYFTLHPPQATYTDLSLMTNVLDWKVFTTDANLFDATANTVKLDIDNRPTGPIYRKELNYQITLQGINVNKNDIKTVPVIFMNNGEITNVNLTNLETMRLFSTSALYPIIGIESDVKFFYNFSKALKYALKRTGDWGQVENCKRYGKVFITCDKLAAFYAKYRGVDFIYLSRIMYGNWYRYTFMVCS